MRKAAIDRNELDEAYKRLKALAQNDEALLKDLDKLKVTADSGLNIRWWFRRFIFGFGLASAIDDWFRAFDRADPSKNLLQRIPREETSNVAAKWAWFGFFGVFASAVFGLLIAIATVIFLGLQYSITREANTNAQRTEYARILFDEKCGAETSVEPDKEKPDPICKPIYNARIRTEAALAFLKLEREKGWGHRPDFVDAHLEGTVLRGANFRGAILAGAILAGANLREAILWEADLGEADLGEADLQKANLWRAILAGAILAGANLRGANLWGAFLVGADLREADLGEADLMGAILAGANLREANLREADLRGATLEGAILRGANLWGADLWRADLVGADLRGANLREAKLREANLRKANLREADLREADLGEANLRKANLRKANLRKANLWKAFLAGADLGGANLGEAFLAGADLGGANLGEVRNLNCERLRKTQGWQSAYRDPELKCGAEIPELPEEEAEE